MDPDEPQKLTGELPWFQDEPVQLQCDPIQLLGEPSQLQG
jgi:hypothetical protein